MSGTYGRPRDNLIEKPRQRTCHRRGIHINSTMTTTRGTFAASLVLFFVPLITDAAISLNHLSTLYLPYQYNPELYGLNQQAAEKSSYDKSGQYILYVGGRDLVHILDYTDPRSPSVIAHRRFPTGEITDVATCGNFVAIALDNKVNPLDGRVYVYRSYNRNTGSFELLHEIQVGPVPDMTTFTGDCQYLLVAIEGELRMISGSPVDPNGQVDIIHFPSGVDQAYTLRTASFVPFNDRANEYIARGVRKVFGNPGDPMITTLSQDLEPEYIALGSDNRTAYVVCQENNAIAVVNIVDAVVQEIYPLGVKSWSSSPVGLDGSDRDGSISFTAWNIFGIYQPDTIKRITVNSVDYIVVANEGAAKEYENQFSAPWTEIRRGKHFPIDEIDESVGLEMVTALAADEALGRLKFTTLDGRTQAGTYNQFYSFGARSFSIFRASDMQIVYDSGDEIERAIADMYPNTFNSNCRDQDESPESQFDRRSDDKGPETEVVEIGQLGNKQVIFVGHERPGYISVYSLPSGSLTPVAEQVYYNGGNGDTWRNLYDRRVARDLEPEDIKFLGTGPPSISGQAMVTVLGLASGTVSFYSVHDSSQDV